ncbi:hypothetical protein QJUYFBOH_CDS0071 [Escherichia phage SHIN8]|nr:hypothetical protein bas23_0067 [Escherichia phage WildeMaa]
MYATTLDLKYIYKIARFAFTSDPSSCTINT